MSEIHDQIASLTADIRATLEWARLTGAEVLPREKLERLIAVPPKPRAVSSTAHATATEPSQARTPEAPSRSRTPEVSAQRPKVPSANPPAESPQQSAPAQERPRRLKASSKWSVLMDAPPTHIMSGPKDAKLVILRGTGSSPDAEEMLSRMLENVLRIRREDVAIYDLARDGREPSVIGLGVVDALSGSAPQAVVVMGTFAARAVLGSEATVADARGRWATLKWAGGNAQARVTHHPEAIIALAARGEAGAKREAFEDLKAVASMLS